MFHFLKYFLLALFFFVVLNLFRSNLDAFVSIKFQVPLILDWSSTPIALNYLLVSSFCVGILFAALLGAFRLRDIHRRKKELKRQRQELDLVKESRTSQDTLPSFNS